MVATMALDEGIIASKVLEGSFHHDSFLEFLHDDVVSTSSSSLTTLTKQNPAANDNSISWTSQHPCT